MVVPKMRPDSTVEQDLMRYEKKPNGEVMEVKVSSVWCQAMSKETITPPLSVAERLASVQDELTKWKVAFENTNGRAPTREDMRTDKTAASLFEQFTKLRRITWQ